MCESNNFNHILDFLSNNKNLVDDTDVDMANELIEYVMDKMNDPDVHLAVELVALKTGVDESELLKAYDEKRN